MIARSKATRAEIHAEVLEEGWSETRGSFTQSYGSDELDASLLLMPIVGFIAADDPRMVATVDAVREELTVDGLLYRYRSDENDCDGLPAGEGAFLACSFWLVEVLALQGKTTEARALFDHLLALRNDVGLLAEEYDTVGDHQLGNFPQAFTHLTLVTAALAIDEAERRR